MKVKSESEVTQLCLTPSDPMDCSLPGSSIHGIFQARVLEWGAIAFSVSALNSKGNVVRLSKDFLPSFLQCMKGKSESEVAQSCSTISDTMDCSLPGSSVHGIFQARVLEWGAMFSLL